MDMNILVVGSGGREHALVWALSQRGSVTDLHAAPGNPGISELAACHRVAADDRDAVVALARRLAVDLVVVGPEAPLVAGLADDLRRNDIAVFGPGAAAARIEASKAFAKDVMQAAGVPTARRLREPAAPCVVKADGLAGGKGVFVCRDDRDVAPALAALAERTDAVVIEELLEGDEVSLFAVCDGGRALPLPAARDFKRAWDADGGPNTGGMGSYSPVDGLGPDQAEELVAAVHVPVLAELERRGSPFVGLLYAGLMLTEDGPRVLEFNCRFGDPETQSVLPRLDGNLAAVLAAAAHGDLGATRLEELADAAVTVVITAERYPDDGADEIPLDGLAAARETGALVFHAGTAAADGRILASGGRVVGVTGVGASLADAREQAYAAAELACPPGLRYRNDIGLAAAQEHAGVR